jgi:hypothetical protein
MNYLVELIIRPQRNQYNLSDLGDSAFSFSGQDFRRMDFANGQVYHLIIFQYLIFIKIKINMNKDKK